MREGYRPFTKLITVSDKDRKTVALKDTGNDSITCNYIKVEPVSGTADNAGAFFYVTPTGVDTELGVTNTLPASGLTLDGAASGNLGAVASCANGSVVLSLLSPDNSFSIFLSHTSDNTMVYAITYGVVTESNTLKDSRLPRGN